MGVLDYVLNRCTIREIDALEAAVERRRRDLQAQSGIISLDPARAARSMSSAVQTSINRSMDGVRETFRKFAVDTIRKEAPELTEEQMDELVNSWIPESMSVGRDGHVESESEGDAPSASRSGGGRYAGLARKGLVNGIPPDAMHSMILQFVAYSTGSMSVSEEASLRDAVGDWTTAYWKKFPKEIQTLIRGFLAGEMDGGEFESGITALLS